MLRHQIINHFINLYDYKTYLEIGINNGRNFKKVKAEHKDGVDPAGNCNFVMTSDDFFKQNKRMYDIIFIDGLHLEEQVLKDVENSLRFLSEHGTILMHDCYPRRERHQVDIQPPHGAWTGTVWKAFAKLRMTRTDLYMRTINSDHGVGIIRRGLQKTLNIKEEDLNYQFFRRRKRKILKLIEVEDFLNEFK